MNLSAIPFLTISVQYDVSAPFAAITASILPGRLSTRLRSVFMGIFDHWWGPTLMLVEKAWLSLSAPIHPKSDSGQDSVQAPDSVIHVFMNRVMLEDEGVLSRETKITSIIKK